MTSRRGWNETLSLDEQKELGITEFIELLIKRELARKEENLIGFRFLMDLIENEYKRFEIIKNPANDKVKGEYKISQKGSGKGVCIYLTKDDWERLRAKCDEEFRTPTNLIQKLVRDYLK